MCDSVSFKADIRATAVTVPMEAALLHANRCHCGRFVRTIVQNSDQVVAFARKANTKYGFISHKLKAGVFLPDYELEVRMPLASNNWRRIFWTRRWM